MAVWKLHHHRINMPNILCKILFTYSVLKISLLSSSTEKLNDMYACVNEPQFNHLSYQIPKPF